MILQSPPMYQTRVEMNARPRTKSRPRGGGGGGERKPEMAVVPARSSQLVVYDANNRALSTHVNRPKRESHVVRCRQGDVRKEYKVLPIVIGTGSFGTVRSCIHRESRTKLAIKSISVKGHAGNSALLRNEIALLQRVNHRNIVKVVDVVQDRDYIHIVMEQCKGGDLFDLTVDDSTRLSERGVRRVVTSLLDAVSYLHDRNIVHRDLKVRDIL